MLSIRVRNNAAVDKTIIMPKTATIREALEAAEVNVATVKFYINSTPFEEFRTTVDATFESIGFEDGENVSIAAVKMTNNAR